MLRSLFWIFFIILQAHTAQAKLQIFACTAEWASLAREITQDKANITLAVKPLHDAHDLTVKPSLINKAKKADLLICNGASLEGNWLPKILESANNSKIMPGAAGHFIAANYIELIELAEHHATDEHGHNHPDGNPHFYLNPHNLLIISKNFSNILSKIDPDNAKFYAKNEQDFANKLSAAITKWAKQAASLKNSKIVTIHKNYDYLLDWLELEEITTIEKLPGVNPSLKYLLETKKLLDQQQEPILALVSPFDNKTYAKWLAENTQAKIIYLPYSPTSDLFNLFSDIIAKLDE